MLVGIDFQPVSYGASGGIVNWISGVLNAYASTFPDDRLFLFLPEGFPRMFGDVPSIRVIQESPATLHRTEAAILSAEAADVLVRAYPQVEQPDFPMDRQIVTIPDMQHADHPEFFTPPDLRLRRLAFGRMLSGVGAVGTMTEFSRARVLDYPWTTCRDVFLMPPAVSFYSADMTHSEHPPWLAAVERLPGFFFMPANSWEHKNHRRLFEAFAAARPRLPAGMALVLTGANPLGAGLTAGFEHLPIIHLGYVNREHLPILYQRATALAFFSMYEGFGMPLLEAFQHGLPVACSNIPAHAEVGGNAVLSCDPTDIAGMADAMVWIASDAALRAGLKQAGLLRLAEYSWTTSAHALRSAAIRIRDRGRAEPVIARSISPQDLSISVVVDIFEDDHVGSEAIRSLLDQTHEHVQVIVVGARHAADAWTAAAGGYRSVRVVCGTLENACERARAGLAAAEGQLIMYLRGDCRVERHALACVARCFASSPSCDIVIGAINALNGAGEVIASYQPPPTADVAVPNLMFEGHLAQLLGGMDVRVSRPLFCWRRRIGDLVGSFSTDYQHAFDLEYYFRLIEGGGALESIQDQLASVCVTDEVGSARRWYAVMSEIPRLLASRGGSTRRAFFQLMHYRKHGIEPRIVARSRPVISWIGNIHHAIWRHRSRAARYDRRAGKRPVG
jgi:glycosyltransferase involved in cell wall biosynthesis